MDGEDDIRDPLLREGSAPRAESSPSPAVSFVVVSLIVLFLENRICLQIFGMLMLMILAYDPYVCTSVDK